VFSGTNDGVFKSTDNGGSWTHLSSSGLNNPYVHCLFFNSAGYLFAGTGISLCRSVEPIITSVDDSVSEIPQSFLLFQNYPNPFNPITKIKYQIPASLNSSKGGTLVTLKVYDLLGSELATLVNEEKSAGTYEVEFDAEQLSSGIYFYQLKAGEFIQTKKMVLIR
ncbi:MAG: T9SS type A sorting domain-containing protein, partial [Ignavibacteriaceae bacterium]|nr:T9SS type A sorting domain-containing protein [Ignavibacteriaceae bacterium]